MQQTHVCFVFLLIRVSKSSDYHYRSIPRINAILFLRKELREREKKVLKEVLSSSDIVLGKCFFYHSWKKVGSWQLVADGKGPMTCAAKQQITSHICENQPTQKIEWKIALTYFLLY